MAGRWANTERRAKARPSLTKVIASLESRHRYAGDYVRQAPVLGVLAYDDARVADAIVACACRGGKVKALMAELGVPPVLRRLRQEPLQVEHGPLVRDLAACLEPKDLGNAVPDGFWEQIVWVRRLHRFRSYAVGHRGAPEDVRRALAWAARNMPRPAPGERSVGADSARNEAVLAQIGPIADFAVSDPAFNPAWGWARAHAETDAWHQRISLDSVLKDLAWDADEVLDAVLEPRVTDDLAFEPLRTPRELVEEGLMMRHCVGTYVRKVAAGHCHIVSVRHVATGKHVATAELEPRSLNITQLRGPKNSRPPDRIMRGTMGYVEWWKARRHASATAGGLPGRSLPL